MPARCKVQGRLWRFRGGPVQGRFRRFRVVRPGVNFNQGSGGSGMVRRRPGVRFKEGSGGSGVVRCRPGVRFKDGSRGCAGQVSGSRKVVEVSGWSSSRKVPGFRGGPARCKFQSRFRRFWHGPAQARCKVQGRFRRFRGGPVQARCKVQGSFQRLCWPGVRFKEGCGDFGVGWSGQV